MKSKKIIIWVVLVFTALNTVAQYNISGNIKDEKTNGNLAGVSVYITDLKTGTSTDTSGNFSISNLKSGVYFFDISLDGYKSIIRQIAIKNDTVIHFFMDRTIHELNEVIVTGVTRSVELITSPIIVKTLDRNAWAQNSSTNIIDGLKNVPGVNQITTGAAISKPVIRGLGYNRVITLNNGIRQEGQQWGDEHGIEMDEFGVDRIEIVKGPGSLMYGSDGIAGVLNFLAPKTLPKGKISTEFISNYQSNNRLIGHSLSNAGNKNGLQWLGRLSQKLSGNYQNIYDGRVYNSGFKEWDGSLFLGINKSWGHSHVTVSSFNQTLNLVEGERDSTGAFTYVNANGDEVTAVQADYKGYKTGFPHQQVQHLRLASNNYFILNKAVFIADFGLQKNKRKEFGDPTSPRDIALYFDLNTLNYNLRLNLEKKKGWETSFGLGGMLQSNTNKGLEFIIPKYHLFDVGAFVFTQKTIGTLTFAGGLRWDNRTMVSTTLYLDSLGNAVAAPDVHSDLKFAALKKNYNGISGSLGFSYQINAESTVKINVSRGFRAPTMAELSSNGRHEGTFRYEIGNPLLKSEISHQIDVAYFLNSEHATFELTPFVNLIGNYIYAQKLTGANGLDSIPNPAEPAPAFKFTSGNASLFGGEIYVDFHPHPFHWLHLENSFSFVQATQQQQPDSLKHLPFIPAPKYRGEIKVQFPSLGKACSNVYLKIGIDHYFPQNNFFSAYGTETRTPAYTLLNAGFGTHISGFHRTDFLSLFISGENLADIAYQNHLSRLKYAPENRATGRVGVYNMGRNISMKLIIHL